MGQSGCRKPGEKRIDRIGGLERHSIRMQVCLELRSRRYVKERPVNITSEVGVGAQGDRLRRFVGYGGV